MRRPREFAVLIVITFALTGCYHQVVRTGATPGGTVIERPWTATYIFGLVPAAAINTLAECPSGVAIVETQQTAVNGIVGFLTLGIYTPQTVTITCATSPSVARSAREIDLPAGAGVAERTSAIRSAIALSRRTGDSVTVHSSQQ